MYKLGDTKKAIGLAIELYQVTNNKYIRYLLCLIFRLELKIYSDYIVEKINGVTEMSIETRNEYFISRWKEIYLNFEDICKMFEDIKVLPKKEIKILLENNESKEFDYKFFKQCKEILDNTPFSPTLMLKKIYGVNFLYDRNGNNM